MIRAIVLTILLSMTVSQVEFLPFLNKESKGSHITSRTVYDPNIPNPIGPYSQAMVLQITDGGVVYTSGQIGLNKDGVLVSDNIEDQTHQALSNLRDLLIYSGSSLEQVVKVNIYLINMGDFDVVNKIYGLYFTDKLKYPPRSCVAVAQLPKNAKIEIEAVAFYGN